MSRKNLGNDFVKGWISVTGCVFGVFMCVPNITGGVKPLEY